MCGPSETVVNISTTFEDWISAASSDVANGVGQAYKFNTNPWVTVCIAVMAAISGCLIISLTHRVLSGRQDGGAFDSRHRHSRRVAGCVRSHYHRRYLSHIHRRGCIQGACWSTTLTCGAIPPHPSC